MGERVWHVVPLSRDTGLLAALALSGPRSTGTYAPISQRTSADVRRDQPHPVRSPAGRQPGSPSVVKEHSGKRSYPPACTAVDRWPGHPRRVRRAICAPPQEWADTVPDPPMCAACRPFLAGEVAGEFQHGIVDKRQAVSHRPRRRVRARADPRAIRSAAVDVVTIDDPPSAWPAGRA